MNQYEEYLQRQGQDPLADVPPSFQDFGALSRDFGSDLTAVGNEYDSYLSLQHQDSSSASFSYTEQRLGNVGFGAAIPGVNLYDRYLQKQSHADQSQLEPTLSLRAVDLMANSDTFVPLTHRRPERRERSRLTGILASIGALTLAASLAIAVGVGSRGHVEAHSAPKPAATGKATPGNEKGWLPIDVHGTINMANAAQDAKLVPPAVQKAKDSTEEILNYGNPDSAGRVFGLAGTGYVETINGRNWLISAAHCVAGTPDQVAYPNYIAETNVNDEEHKDLVLGFKVPKSYNRLTDTFVDSPSDDLSIIGVMPVEWWDGSGHHMGDNGWNELPALQNATNKPGIGSLVFTYGYRPEKGLELEPPQEPVLQAMVVVGYSDDGSRMILLPVETTRPSDQQDGNSGAAIVNKLGRVVSTLIAGGHETEQRLQSAFHVKVIGGDGAKIDPGKIFFEVAMLNNRSNIAQAWQANPVRLDVPSRIPN